MMTFERALELAKKKILLPGIKPEDYYQVSDDMPLRIATLIVKEAKHILWLNQQYQQLRERYGQKCLIESMNKFSTKFVHIS